MPGEVGPCQERLESLGELLQLVVGFCQEGGGNGAGGEDAEGGGGTLRRTCAGEGEIVREALALGDIQIIQIKYHNSIYK